MIKNEFIGSKSNITFKHYYSVQSRIAAEGVIRDPGFQKRGPFEKYKENDSRFPFNCSTIFQLCRSHVSKVSICLLVCQNFLCATGKRQPSRVVPVR